MKTFVRYGLHWLLLSITLFTSFPAKGQQVKQQIDSLNAAGLRLKFSNPDSSHYYCRLALTKAEAIGYQKGILQAYNTIGSLMAGNSHFDSALYYHLQALDIAKKLRDQFEEAESLNNIGIIKDELGDHQAAIESYLGALRIYEELNYKEGQARTNNNLGIVYKDMGQYEEVIAYYTSAMNLYDSLSNQFGVAALSNNLSTLYNELGDYQMAVTFAEKAKRIFIASGLTQFVPYCEINLGDAYRRLGQFKNAEYNLANALSGLIQSGNIKEQSDVKRSFSNLYQDEGKIKIAIQNAHESLNLARQVNAKVYEKNALQRLAEVYEAAGDLNTALQYFKKYEVSKDSLLNEERVLQVNRLQTLFETEKKETTIANQRLVLERNSLELATRRNQIIVISSLAIILLLGGILFYVSRQAKQKRIMHEAIVIEKEKGINAMIEAQDEERSRIAKDLHDGLGQQIGGLKLAIQNMSQQLDDQILIKEKVKQLINIVDDTAEDLRSISHEMMPKALAEVGLVPAMEDMLQKNLNQAQIDYVFDHADTDKRYPSKVEISVYRIFQEVINNIIKHAGAKSVSVQLIHLSGRLILIVEDDGRGIRQAPRKGHGLYNMTNRASMLGGSIVFEQGKNYQGTVVTVNLPVS